MNTLSQFYPDVKSFEEIKSFIANIVEYRLGLRKSELLCIESTSGNSSLPFEAVDLASIGSYCFNIGGLAGFPFQGISGLQVSPKGICESGAVMIFYACEVVLTGSDKDEHPVRTSAVNLALNKLQNGQILLDHIGDLDYQMNFIEQVLFREQRKIKSALVPLLEAAEVMYEAVDRRIQLLVTKTSYSCQYVILAGAIQYIDLTSKNSYYVLKRFACLDAGTKEKIDWKKLRRNS